MQAEGHGLARQEPLSFPYRRLILHLFSDFQTVSAKSLFLVPCGHGTSGSLIPVLTE